MKPLLFALALIVSTTSLAEVGIPELNRPVNDFANVLSRAGKERIAKEILDIKAETGASVGVVILTTLGSSPIEEWSMQAARDWKLGSKNRDDGLLLVVVINDHKMRIEVGYGLEGIVPDIQARHVTESMKPQLRNKDYDGAILTAVRGLSSLIKAGKDDITSKGNPEPESQGHPLLFILLGLVGMGGILAYFASRKEKQHEEHLTRRMSELGATTTSQSSDNTLTNALLVANLMHSSEHESYSSSDDSSSSFGSSSDDSSSSSSDWSGGGGDFGGGGSSDSW